MKKVIRILFALLIITILINVYVVIKTNSQIIDMDNIKENDFDCILVLGAGLRDKRPSPMLEERLIMAIKLYELGIAPKILVSGDHEYNKHDEVNVMKNYLIENGISSHDIFMDHAGISTYDSVYRAKEIFKVHKMVIVTQKYHLYRALYIAKSLDFSTVGVIADREHYYGQTKRDIREFAARIKDFFKCIIKPASHYLGEIFPISGDGNQTNDN